MTAAEESMDVTTGEVVRRLDRTDDEVRRLATDTRAGFQALSDKLERLPFVPTSEYAANRTADQERIGRVESGLEKAQQRAWQTWSALALAVVAALLPLLLAQLSN